SGCPHAEFWQRIDRELNNEIAARHAVARRQRSGIAEEFAVEPVARVVAKIVEDGQRVVIVWQYGTEHERDVGHARQAGHRVVVVDHADHRYYADAIADQPIIAGHLGLNLVNGRVWQERAVADRLIDKADGDLADRRRRGRLGGLRAEQIDIGQAVGDGS